jgi:hypothetical protein
MTRSQVGLLAVLGIGAVVMAVLAHRVAAGTAFDHAVLAWFVERRRGALTSAAFATPTSLARRRSWYSR